MSAFARFYFRPSKGEWIHTTVGPGEGDGCGIFGRVEEKGAPVSGALVMLLKAEGEAAGTPLSSVTTDSDGEFAFGPLAPGQLYAVKVFRDSLKIRELEIQI